MSEEERMAEREFEAEFDRLQQENQALKKQLSEIKYLDRKEVKSIFLLWQSRGYLREDSYINAICSLALPTRERIVKILKKYGLEIIQTSTKMIYPCDIASEILGDDKNEI